MRSISAAGLIATTALVAGAIASPAIASSTKPIEQVLPALSAGYVSADAIPEVVDLETFGVLDEDVRAVGSDEVADYWIARQGSENVCLIIYIRGGNEVSSASCTTIADFNLSGLSLVTGEDRSAPDRSSEAYYLPADVATSEIPGETNMRRSAGSDTQLIAGRPGELGLNSSIVSRDDGSEFKFVPLESAE